MEEELRLFKRDTVPHPIRNAVPGGGSASVRFGVVTSIGDGTEETVQVHFLKQTTADARWVWDGSSREVDNFHDWIASQYEPFLCTISGAYALNAGFKVIPLVRGETGWVALPFTGLAMVVISALQNVRRTDSVPPSGSGGGRSTGGSPFLPASAGENPPTGDATNTSFTPTDDSDWTGDEDPGNVDNALDQLAERLAALEEAPGGGASELSDLSDVNSSTPTAGNVLRGDGDAWESTTLAASDLSDIDTTTDPPALNDVLKFNGTNFVPGIAGDATEFTFSIDSFTDNDSDFTQLIGDPASDWKAIAGIEFEATYSNAPGGMTAEVAMSGADTAWAGNLSMTPVEGAEANTEAVTYPTSAGDQIVFTLSQDADASEDTLTYTFNNTMRYGNSARASGQGTLNIENLSEVSGPNESRNNHTISNIPTTANYLVFAYADRLSDVQQVQRNSGNGYVTASFNATRTTVAPTVQTGVTNVDNSAGYSETFACITSTDTGLADGADDFKLLTNSTAVNYIRGGGNTESTPGDYTEADIETGLTDDFVDATNDHTQLWPTVTLLASEHYVIAIPARLGTPTFKDNDTGFAASFQAPATLAITNDAGFQENYNVFVSTNPLGPGDFNLLTE